MPDSTGGSAIPVARVARLGGERRGVRGDLEAVDDGAPSPGPDLPQEDHQVPHPSQHFGCSHSPASTATARTGYHETYLNCLRDLVFDIF